MGKEVIQYEELNLKWLVFKYPRNEIRKGSKLVVRVGQKVVLAVNGQIADTFDPGDYILDSGTMTKVEMLGEKFGFMKNAVRADLYFLNTTLFMNNGWGTKDPIVKRDEELKVVRVTAYGKYSFKLDNPVVFLNEVFGTRTLGTETQETVRYISDRISQNIVKALADSEFSFIDMSSHYEEIANGLMDKVNSPLQDLGIRVEEILIESIGTTRAVNETIDDVTGMNLVKDDFDNYERFQAAKGLSKGNSHVVISTLKSTGETVDGMDIVEVVDEE